MINFLLSLQRRNKTSDKPTVTQELKLSSQEVKLTSIIKLSYGHLHINLAVTGYMLFQFQLAANALMMTKLLANVLALTSMRHTRTAMVQ